MQFYKEESLIQLPYKYDKTVSTISLTTGIAPSCALNFSYTFQRHSRIMHWSLSSDP